MDNVLITKKLRRLKMPGITETLEQRLAKVKGFHRLASIQAEIFANLNVSLFVVSFQFRCKDISKNIE